MGKSKKPIPEKYKKAIEESNKYMSARKDTKKELNLILVSNKK